MSEINPVRIPANVEREDKIIADLTARQLAILAVTGVTVWVAYLAVGELLPLPVFGALVVVVVAAGVILALGRRDGVSADRLLLAALRYARTPHRQVLAPEGVPGSPAWVVLPDRVLPAPLDLPVEAIGEDGVIDLGPGGVALIAEASTVSFALRAPHEQQALVAGFARWLNSLTAPVQILVRAEWVDLSPMITDLEETAPSLPHPALEQAAREHAAFLAELNNDNDLLRRQVLLVLIEPAAARDKKLTAERVRHRLDTAARALATAEITVTPLDGGQVAAILATAANPLAPPHAPDGWAAPDDVITGGPA
jgi:hypothetical protein